MKNPPPPLHSRYPPRKLLLFLLSITHPATGVMAAVRHLIKGYTNNGNKNTTRLINNTNVVMEFREFRGINTGENNIFSAVTVKAGEHTDIDATKYGGDDSQGGQPSYLKIFCDGSFLRSSERNLLVLPGEDFISFETVTIAHQPPVEDQSSTGVVNYKVIFKPRDASVSTAPLKVFRDLLDHDNGWSVQHFENGSVKLTRKGNMTMTLDPSKLFASNIVDDPEIVLLRMVLKFWPSTFADLKCKDDSGRAAAVCVVNVLMCQAKLYRIDRSKVEVAEVVDNVSALNKLCAARVEWYRPLFPGMEDRFPTMAEVDQEKLKKFATTIEPMLRQPNSLPGRSS